MNKIFILLVSILISSCSILDTKDSAPDEPFDVSGVVDAVPKVEALSPYGNPSSYVEDGIRYTVLKTAQNYKAVGTASWYGTKFDGQRTSSGETYSMYAMTAAHKTLPLPTYVKVKNLENGNQVVVKVNDRGPFVEGRIIDMSYAAAIKLGFHLKGTAEVEVESIVMDGSHKLVGPSEIPTGKKMYVQVGAYSSKQKAEKLAGAIGKEVPWRVYVSKVSIGRKVLFRVRIGPIDSTDAANQLVETLSIPELGVPKVIFE